MGYRHPRSFDQPIGPIGAPLFDVPTDDIVAVIIVWLCQTIFSILRPSRFLFLLSSTCDSLRLSLFLHTLRYVS